MKARERLAGFGRVFAVSRRVAFAIAVLLAGVIWTRLEQGTWLPWTVQNVLTGIVFFFVFVLAWGLGGLPGPPPGPGAGRSHRRRYRLLGRPGLFHGDGSDSIAGGTAPTWLGPALLRPPPARTLGSDALAGGSHASGVGRCTPGPPAA